MTEQSETASGTTLRSIDIEPMLELALHMANRADEIAMAGFGVGTQADTKADGSPVTRVDREIEAMIRDTIEREHPRAGILGEEYGEDLGVGRWVIDPIDGTREFVRGDPRFAVLIAYEIDDESLLGVVSAPALGVRWWAGEGAGARMSYRGAVSAARVSVTKKMTRAHGLILGGFQSRASAEVDELLRGNGATLKWRGVSWEAARVASAEYDFGLTCGHRWDVAPLPVIVREAGGWSWIVEGDDGLSRIAVSNRQLADDVSLLLPELHDSF